MKTTDAIVVGGGPAGSTAACLLAREGLGVVLLDRDKFPRDKPCGEFINPAACDSIEALFGISRADLISAGGSPVSSVRLQLRNCPALQIPMIDDKGSGVSGVSLRRVAGDAMLVNNCRARGVQVFEEHNVRSVRAEGSQFVVAGLGQSGPFEYRARMVIAADGTHSVIARQEGLTIPKPGLKAIGVVAHFRGLGGEDGAGVWMFPSTGDGLMFGFARQSDGTAVLSGSVPRHLARSLVGTPEVFVRNWIAGHSDLRKVLDGATFDGPIRTTACFGHRLKRAFGPGILFLGDAARFSDPFTGEGIHHAIESGILAARTAIPALTSGDTSAKALSGYERDRSELSSRYSLCEVVRAVCLRPGLLDFVSARLRVHPSMGSTLIGALVNVLPSRNVLSARFALRAMLP